MIERSAEVAEVGLPILPLDRVDADALVHQCRGDVVLGGERVGGAEHRVGAAGLERLHQRGGFAGDVHASGDANAGQRPLPRESLPDDPQDGHRSGCPIDAPATRLREFRVLDVEGKRVGADGGVGWHVCPLQAALAWSPVASRRAWARSVFSQLNSGSERPK